MNDNRSGIITAFLCFCFISLKLFSQSPPDQITAGDAIVLHMPQVSLIATNNAPVSMTLTTSTPGAAIGNSTTNNDLWVRVTSVVPGGTHRDILAKITGTVPPGTQLTLLPLAATTANSAGTLGTPISSPIVLSSVDQQIIADIGSCYTGTGPSDGYRMVYTWSLVNPAANFGLLQANTGVTVTVYITLTQANNSY